MQYQFIDIPRFVAPKVYEEAIRSMTARLSKEERIVSVYSLGSISNPGISDIDMLAIFEDNVRSNFNCRNSFSDTENYLFTHNVFGISQTNFAEAQKYTLFNNYKLLFGKAQFIEPDTAALKDEIFRKQVAIGYLIKMFVTLTVQKTYRIFKLRALLLEAKAVLYDLQFLNIEKGPLGELLNQILQWRASWFTKRPSDKELIKWIDNFYNELCLLLKAETGKSFYHHSNNKSVQLAKNMRINFFKRDFNYSHKGLLLFPSLAKLFEKKYFNLLHRFNHFEFNFPAKPLEEDNFLSDKMRYDSIASDYVSVLLPHFNVLSNMVYIQQSK